jgi:hypothetical protein
MAFFRNVQVRWMPIQGDTRFTVALERPGASADAGIYADRIELEDVQARFPLPDVSAEYRIGQEWGYFEVAGIARHMEWDDLNDDEFDLSGDALGWGVNVSSNLKFNKDTVRLGAVVGEGIQNYMNDAPVDVGTAPGDDPETPIEGEPLPLVGISAFLDHTWNDKWTTTVGYSHLDIENSEGQAPSAFAVGQYALLNAMYYPVANVMLGPEIQWGRRENNSDGFDSDDLRFQFSFKYNFSQSIGD